MITVSSNASYKNKETLFKDTFWPKSNEKSIVEKQGTKVCLIEYNIGTSSGAYELKREYASTSDLITHTRTSTNV